MKRHIGYIVFLLAVISKSVCCYAQTDFAYITMCSLVQQGDSLVTLGQYTNALNTCEKAITSN